MLNTVAETLFWISLLVPVLVFVVNPLSIVLASVFLASRNKDQGQNSAIIPTISVLIVAHMPGRLLEKKLQNCAEFDYPSSSLEIIVILDGKDANAVSICKEFAAKQEEKIKFSYFEFLNQRGKIPCLNDAILKARNEILLFSDVDALIVPGSLFNLMKHFDNPRVGGVAGCKRVASDNLTFNNPQQLYWRADSWLKRLESKLGSVTSNDGKIYALRRDLCSSLPTTVTDDFYNCLSILQQHYIFSFEPLAIAMVPTPSRSERHEVVRRRRIVCRSLHCLWLMRGLLNPFRFGWLSIRLAINKVLRRFLPVAFLLFLASSFVLSFMSLIHLCVFGILFCVIGFACTYPLLPQKFKQQSAFLRFSSAAWYFLLGLCGTGLGLMDFMLGRRVSTWIPFKND